LIFGDDRFFCVTLYIVFLGKGVRRISGFTFKSTQRFSVRLESLNVGSLSGRGTKVCEKLKRKERMSAVYKK